jgi:cell shape-determining protein MreC
MSVEEQSTAGQLAALNQLAALGASEQPDVAKILHDSSRSAYDRIYLAVSTVVGQLDEEITQHLDALRETEDFDGEMAKYKELSQKRAELQETMTRLYEEENERIRKEFQSES